MVIKTNKSVPIVFFWRASVVNKIISQYILRELFTTWVGVTLVLLIVLVTNKFADVISDIAAGDILSSSLLPIIALSSIEYLIILLPLSTFLSVIIVIGRFYRDHEMTAIQVAGKGTGFIYKIFFFPLIVLIFILGFISTVIPQCKQVSYWKKRKQCALWV